MNYLCIVFLFLVENNWFNDTRGGHTVRNNNDARVQYQATTYRRELEMAYLSAAVNSLRGSFISSGPVEMVHAHTPPCPLPFNAFPCPPCLTTTKHKARHARDPRARLEAGGAALCLFALLPMMATEACEQVGKREKDFVR